MRLLIDTNVLIPLEPTRHEDLEPGSRVAAELVRLAHATGQTILVHPNCLVDLRRDADPGRSAARDVLVRKYVRLEPAPALASVEPVLGPAAPGSNDWVDHSLLAAVSADAVDVVVTQDGGIHRKAARLGLSDRVLTVEDALAQLQTLHDTAPSAPPAVELLPVHAMDGADPIFDSFRAEYPDFDAWLVRAKRQGREGWVIAGPDGTYAGVCIIKQKDDDFRLGGKVLKICTLKVAAEHQGNRYGELLLKTIFTYCRENAYDHTYLTVFEHYEGLIALLEEFGFRCLHGKRTPLGEFVYAKDLAYTSAEARSLDSLTFHVRFGPPAVRLERGHVYVVPIEPRYHAILFPEGEAQPQLAIIPRPYGNALRKAYLCNAPIRRLVEGDTLLFYRSHDLRAVTALGVVEDVLVSRDADEIVAMVGQRTVYSYDEIRHLARGEVVAIMFRQDRLFENPIALQELVSNGAIRRAPQSITSVSGSTIEWLAHRVGEPSFFLSDLASPTRSSTA